MTVGELVLVLTLLATVVILLRTAYLLTIRIWHVAGRTALAFGAGLAGYSLVLVSVSVLSPQRVLTLHQDRCFDDWCLSVERVAHRHDIGTVAARGKFYLVTVRVSSHALRATQRALDADVYLVDAHGRRYDPVPAARRMLDRSGASGRPLDTELPPGGWFTRTVAFDLPVHARRVGLVVTHGLFPDVLVIGDPQSFLYKRTIILL